MKIFRTHRLRGKTITAAQRAYTENLGAPALAQQRMLDIFEGYLDKKPHHKSLGKAQVLLNHHFSNRTRAEKQVFTTSLFAVCARRHPHFAAAAPLAQICNMAQSMARIQAIAQCQNTEASVDAAALEQAYAMVFERERTAEALVFHLAGVLSMQDMRVSVAFLTDPAVIAVRKHIASLLCNTPEADPLAIDLVGHSEANTHLQASPPGPLPGVNPAIEAKVRALLQATWSPAVSLAGMLALCCGLKHAQLDLLLGFCTSDAYQRLLAACEDFTVALPGMCERALDWELEEAFRDHTRAKPSSSGHDAHAPQLTWVVRDLGELTD